MVPADRLLHLAGFLHRPRAARGGEPQGQHSSQAFSISVSTTPCSTGVAIQEGAASINDLDDLLYQSIDGDARCWPPTASMPETELPTAPMMKVGAFSQSFSVGVWAKRLHRVPFRCGYRDKANGK